MSVEPSSFLLKEQELMKMNEVLNEKTKSLLVKTEAKFNNENHNKTREKPRKNSEPKNQLVVSRKEDAPPEQNQSKVTDVETQPKNCAEDMDLPVISRKITETKKEVQKTPLIPQRLDKINISSEGLIKFLKSKVIILQDEIDILQKENIKKAEEVQLTNEKCGKLEQQKEQLSAKNNSLLVSLKKAEERISETELKIKEKETDSLKLGKEGDVIKRDVKTLQQANASLERKLVKAQEELNALKVNLGNAYDREKELRDKARMEKEGYEKQLKQFRKQRVGLITAYKQQLLLLDNLKRQNLCMEEAKMIEFSEKEFAKILNWEK